MSHLAQELSLSANPTGSAVGSSQENDATEVPETSLFHEIHETIRRILQHAIFASILTLRLYMLPLLYLANRLATGDTSQYLTTWHLLLSPRENLAICPRCQPSSARSLLVSVWNTARIAVLSPFQVARTLYSLGKLMNEDPSTFQPVTNLVNSAAHRGTDVLSDRRASLKEDDCDSTNTRLTGPASASQVYHAALLNGNTLDNILAGFEATPPECRDSGNTSIPTSPIKRFQWSREPISSITSTPEQMLKPQQPETTTPSLPKVGDMSSTNHFATPLGNPNVNQAAAASEPRVLASTASCSGLEDAIHEQGRMPVAHLKRCPTFARRQTQSLLPRRASAVEKRSPLGSQKRATMSTPALGVASAKRARLQRRIKVHRDGIGAIDGVAGEDDDLC